MIPELRSILLNAGLDPEEIYQVQLTWAPPKGAPPKIIIDYQTKADTTIQRVETEG